MDEIIAFIYDNVLSIIMMVLLIAVGLFLTFKLRFLQFSKFNRYCITAHVST
jgi:Na+/alanine symporter